MKRVLKSNGSIILISYGTPFERFKCFQSGLGFEDFYYYVLRKSLSAKSQITNLMRYQCEENQGIKDVLKDKVKLMKVFLEFGKIKRKIDEEKPELF